MATPEDALALRYGHKIRLGAASAYASLPEGSPFVGVGYYEKNGRHGILSCVPPLGDKTEHSFYEEEFTVLDPTGKRMGGDAVHYGHTVVLVNQHGMVWNNKTGGITGYVGPRPRNITGEMYVSFRLATSAVPPPASSSKTSSRKEKERDMASITSIPASSSSSSLSESSSSLSSAINDAVAQGPVRFGDHNVCIRVVESNRHSQMFNKRLTNFKKPTSRIAGGYICCDGKGTEMRFTIFPATPRVEQISMLNKLITAYNYGQKIALPWALLESTSPDKKLRMEQAEIRFQLSNQAVVTLPGKLLQSKLVAHAVEPSSKEIQSTFVLPVRSGPGELVVKLTGVAPRKALGSLSGAGAANGSSTLSRPKKVALLSQVVAFLRGIPVPIFALLYASVTHFLWRGLSTLQDGLVREVAVLFLMVWPVLYVAVKVDHPISSFLTSSNDSSVGSDEPQSDGTLKLIVVEYRFPMPSVASLSGAAASGTELSNESDGRSSRTGSNASRSVPKRFILAEKGDEEKALVRYQETTEWRATERVDGILAEPSPNHNIIKQNYPHFYHKRGKNDEPVYYEKPGKINLKALKAAGLTLDDLMRNYLQVTEFLWQVIEQDDNKKCISVVDVEGIGLSDFAGEAVEYVRKAASVSGKHYPERCAYIFVINVPSWFSVIWNTVKGMVDEVTREKVIIVRGKKKILEALQERIPMENIPEEYGGLSQGTSDEEALLGSLMAYLNKEEDAPATNPVEAILAKKPVKH